MLKTINKDDICFTYYIPETKEDDDKLKGRTSDWNDNNNKTSEINVHPNPADDLVLFNYPTKSDYSLKLFDINGHQIINKKLPNTGQFYLDLSNIAAGLYFYHLNSSNGKNEVGKLLIQK